MAEKRRSMVLFFQIGLFLWAWLLQIDFGSPQHKGGVVGTSAKETLARNFRNPPIEYGPVDNWWWEAGHLDREKIRWQLEEMKEKGISGTWFYPRWLDGRPLSSDPPYWSEKWWDFTRFSAEEHKRLGLTSWFSNWTFNQFEQTRIRAERETNPALWGRRLVIYKRESEDEGSVALEIPPQDEILEAAAYKKKGNSLDYASRLGLTDSIRDRKLEWKAPGPGWLLTVLAAQPWDIDYLNKVVGNRWSQVFLREYEKRLPEFVGNTLEAFGADEMLFLNGNTLFSRSLLGKVQSERGYDLSPYLIGLFFDIGPKTDQVRCDYYDTMAALLEENFYRPPSRWLEDRRMKHSTLSQIGVEDPLARTYHYGDFSRFALVPRAGQRGSVPN